MDGGGSQTLGGQAAKGSQHTEHRSHPAKEANGNEGCGFAHNKPLKQVVLGPSQGCDLHHSKALGYVETK